MLGSLGKVTVTTAGTLVRATSGQTNPAAHIPVQGIIVQALSSNTGKVYIGISTLNKSTLAGILFILGISGGPTSFSVSQLATAGVGLEELYFDVDTSGEGVIVGYIVG